VRGLKSTAPQLTLAVGEGNGAKQVWETMSAGARERVLRLLAGAIGRAAVGGKEESDDRQG
jgi:hypothetical protein